MLIDKNLIIEAKNKLGEKAAFIIAEDLKLEGWDEKNLKSICPVHKEDTPSFIWDGKENANFFKCFGCGNTINIIDHYMSFYNLTYLEAVAKLFKLVDIDYRFSEKGLKANREYKYPEYISSPDRLKVEEYFLTRKISSETLDYCDVRQSGGKIMWNFYDENDTLLTVKCRHPRKLEKGEPKEWYLPNFDYTPILYNMNKIDVGKPLLIVEGQMDCLSIIESGYKNVVSVPGGTENLNWITTCFEWLEQFNKIILWADNDESGIKMRKEIISRIGAWKCLSVNLPLFVDYNGTQIKLKDANDVLVYIGKEKVLEYINNAQEVPVQGVINLADVSDFDLEKAPGLYPKLDPLDKIVYKFLFGSVVVMTGKRGCVDCDTEYFNGNTWKPISQYQEGERVLQYNKDGSANLILPSQYHKYKEDNLWHIKTKYGIDQCLSDEHEIVYWTTKGNLAKKSFKDFRENYPSHGFSGCFPTIFEYSGEGIKYDDNTIRLLVASVCDGGYHYELSEKAKTYTQCRFHLKKDRKKERLIKLLKQSSFEWRQIESVAIGYTDFYIDLPIRIKEFDDMWYNCSQDQLKIVCDEVLHWDGAITKNRKSYFTTIKRNADFIQFAFTSTGHTSSIITKDRRGRTRFLNNKTYTTKSIDYQVIVTPRKWLYPNSGISKRNEFVQPYKTKDGYKYCFTVDSGMLILRRNNKIFITGNSGKSSLLNQLFISESLNQGYDTFVFSGELDTKILKSWIEINIAGSEHIKMKNDFVHVIDSESREIIRKWYDGRIWVYDENTNDADKILEKAITVTRKYGVKVWILDNLMTIGLNANDTNIYQKQKDFIVKIVGLAKLYNVLIVLVSHPRKTASFQLELTADDVSGSSDITNLAAYLLSVHRFSESEKKGEKDSKGMYKKGKEPILQDVAVDVLKNRYVGKVSRALLYFNYSDYRFYSNPNELFRRYRWNKDTSPLPKIDPNKHIEIPPELGD